MKKQPEKTAQTKAVLTTAFWELYKDKPITKITVKDVTDRAGFYRSTFYLYFTDVYAILTQIEDDILKTWETMVSEVLEQGKHEMMFEMVTAFYERFGEFITVLLSPQGDPSFQQKIKDTLRPKMLSQLQTSSNKVEVSLIFEFVISAMLAFLTEWYKTGRQISANEAIHLLRSLVSKNAISLMLHKNSAEST